MPQRRQEVFLQGGHFKTEFRFNKSHPMASVTVSVFRYVALKFNCMRVTYELTDFKNAYYLQIVR